MDNKIYQCYGNDAHKMALMLLNSANIAAEIPQNARIALKPNLVIAGTPESGATTHVGIVVALIEYLRDNGFNDITIMEGSWVGDSTMRAYRTCGYPEISKKYKVPLVDLKKDTTQSVNTPIGKLQVCKQALAADYLISLPVLKGHCQTTMTCCLKNSKGCLPDSEKRRFHTLGLHQPIAALATAFKPNLFVVDSICGDLNFEEGGTPIQTNRMFMGHDPVQLDSYGCKLMGLEPYSIDYIRLAEGWHVGKLFASEDEIINVNEPKDAPKYPTPSGIVARLTRGVKQKNACSACYGNLVHALYRLEDEYGRHISEPLFIGQGFAGETLDGIGIGKCCRDAKKCAMGCPPTADAILNALLEE